MFVRNVLVYSIDCVVLTVLFGIGVDVVRKSGVVVLWQVRKWHVQIGWINEVFRRGIKAVGVQLIRNPVRILEKAVCDRKIARGQQTLTEGVTGQIFQACWL